jgi:spermidine synthase
MSSTEFFSMVKEHLKDGGVMVVNMNMYSEELNSSDVTINACLADTISSVFENVVVVDVPNNTNKELFATDSEGFMDRLLANADHEESEALKSILGRVYDTAESYEAGTNIMTDDKAPVELLGMKQIDLIIKDEVSYYKKIYKEQGLRGLLTIT